MDLDEAADVGSAADVEPVPTVVVLAAAEDDDGYDSIQSAND